MHFHDKRLKNQYFYKLASRNVRKCAKDYFIYFFTLMLSVALFYSFNSVSTQFASLGLEDSLNYLAFSSGVLTFFSVLVCFIMGTLVVYANRFLLKRRKKEMGLYATLGMARRDVNRLLMRETFCIGVFSLAVGLLLGIFAAQILSLATAKLAGVSLMNYRFMISGKAVVLSILFFGILFFFVHLFNVKELNKMSLLDMLYADRKNETVSEGNAVVTVLLAIVSVALILGGYGVLIFQTDSGLFKVLGTGGLLLMSGTVFFFTAVLRFGMRLRKLNKWYYYRGINMFTTSQISSRLKSEGRTIAMTSVLLFLSLSLTIIGPGLGKYVMNGVEHATPYDGSVSFALIGRNASAGDPMEGLLRSGFKLDRYSDEYEASWIYEAPSVMADFLTGGEPSYGEASPGDDSEAGLAIMGVNDYNRLLALQGIAPVYLAAGEFGINYAFPTMEKTLEAFEKNPKPLRLGDSTFVLTEEGIWNHAWENRNALLDQGLLIVPQEITENLTPVRWVLNYNVREGMDLSAYDFRMEWLEADTGDYILWTRQEALISLTADNLLMTYLGLYLGITFLITAGAVLAIQQLSQSTDNVKRYGLLEKLGVSKRTRRRSLKKQLRLYFGFPLLLALAHSAVAVAAVFRNFEGLEAYVMVQVVGFGVMMVFTVYAVYFITTYVGSRRILQV